MQKRRRNQLAENAYFSSLKPQPQEQIRKGKDLYKEIPSVKLVNQTLLPYFSMIKLPRPFPKSKRFRAKWKSSDHEQFQHLEKLKYVHYERQLISEQNKSEAEFLPQSIQQNNQLILKYNSSSNQIVLGYFDEQIFNELQCSYDHKTKQILNVECKETKINLRDATGTYQCEQLCDSMYIRHMYSVEQIVNNKSINIYKSTQQYDDARSPIIKHMMIQPIRKQLYILNNYGIRTLDSVVHQECQNVQIPYQAISLHKSYNPFNCYVLSMGEIKLYDARTKSIEAQVCLDLNELIHNRFYTMHQFETSQYIVASTNRNLQFYDLRSPKMPLFIHKHNCMETEIHQFVEQTNLAKHLTIKQYRAQLENDNIDASLFKPSRNILIGYSSNSNGQAIMINFESGIVRSIQSEGLNLRYAANLLHNQSLQNVNSEQSNNGLPQMLATSENYCKYLKIRGFQSIPIGSDNILFSLDQQGGIGLQLFDKELNPYKINDKHSNTMDQFEMIFQEIQVEDAILKRDRYDLIFEDLTNSEESQDDLEEICEFRSKIRICEMPVIEKQNHIEQIRLNKVSQSQDNFEDMILQDDPINLSCNQQSAQYNKQFILSQQIIDQILNANS